MKLRPFLLSMSSMFVLNCAGAPVNKISQSLSAKVAQTMACDGGLQIAESKAQPKYAEDEELRSFCEASAPAFQDFLRQYPSLSFAFVPSAKQTSHHKDLAHYDAGRQQIVFREKKTEGMPDLCRHELVHAACDVGALQFKNSNQTFALMYDLIQRQYLPKVQFAQFQDILNFYVTEIETDLQMQIAECESGDARNDLLRYSKDLLPKLRKILVVIDQLVKITQEGSFELSFAGLKQYYDLLVDRQMQILDIIHYELPLAAAFQKAYPKIELLDDLKKFEDYSTALFHRWQYVLQPEELLAFTAAR